MRGRPQPHHASQAGGGSADAAEGARSDEARRPVAGLQQYGLGGCGFTPRAPPSAEGHPYPHGRAGTCAERREGPRDGDLLPGLHADDVSAVQLHPLGGLRPSLSWDGT